MNLCIFTSINEQSVESIKSIFNKTKMKFNNIDIIHIQEIFSQVYTQPFTYPNEPQKDIIKKDLEEMILNEFSSLLEYTSSINVKCIFAHDKKHEAKTILDNNDYDLVITSVKRKNYFQNLFHSSFTKFINTYSDKSILTIKYE